MTSGGGGDKPQQPPLHDDPMQYPASEAGWDDAQPSKPAAPGATSATPPSATSAASPPPTSPASPPPTSPASPPSTSPAPPPPTSAASPPPTSPASPPPTSPASPPPTSPAPPVTSAASPSPASTKAPASDDDGPLLPATYDKNDLRAAVGASPLTESPATLRKQRAPVLDHRPDDDEPAGPPRNRTTLMVSAVGITAGLAIVALLLVGRANRDRYLLACEAERAVPEQGRAFPPWGTHALEGEAWRPLKITPETRCQPHETDEPLVLERLYLAMILDQATALLTAREVTRLDEAEGLLKQGLLLTRPPAHEPEKLAAERNEHHKDIERMLGDVTYWRASTRLHDAATALADAAKQFDVAAAQHPRHVSDAEAWATYARKLAEELHAGPAGATSPGSPPAPAAVSPTGSPAASAALASEHPNVPTGVALPVEPDKGSADVPPPAPAPPDAGAPTGGVLL